MATRNITVFFDTLIFGMRFLLRLRKMDKRRASFDLGVSHLRGCDPFQLKS